MTLAHRLGRLETRLGMPRRGTPAVALPRVTSEEAAAAAERYRTALTASIAALLEGRALPEAGHAADDLDRHVLEQWARQRGVPLDTEWGRIVSDVLATLSDEDLERLQGAVDEVGVAATGSGI